jgi:hypothetical protein
VSRFNSLANFLLTARDGNHLKNVTRKTQFTAFEPFRKIALGRQAYITLHIQLLVTLHSVHCRNPPLGTKRMEYLPRHPLLTDEMAGAENCGSTIFHVCGSRKSDVAQLMDRLPSISGRYSFLVRLLHPLLVPSCVARVNRRLRTDRMPVYPGAL